MRIASTLQYAMSKKVWQECVCALDVHRFLYKTVQEDQNKALIVLGGLPEECEDQDYLHETAIDIVYADTAQRAVNALKLFEPDLVVLNGYPYSWDAHVIREMPEVNTLVRIRCDLPWVLERYQSKELLNAKHIWVSYVEDANMLKKMGYKGHIVVSPGGIDPEPFDIKTRRVMVSPEAIDLTLFRDAKQERDIDFASILHHNPMKGGSIAKNVMEILAGRGYKTELLGYLPQHEFAERLKRTKIFYFPSPMFDGCPRVPREAMYAGCKVVFDAGSANCKYLCDELGGMRIRSDTVYLPESDTVRTLRPTEEIAADLIRLRDIPWAHDIKALEDRHPMEAVYKFFKGNFIK